MSSHVKLLILWAALYFLVYLVAAEPARAAGPESAPLYLLQLREHAAQGELEEEEESAPEVLLFTYTVQRGDNLLKIAGRFGTGVDTLLRINNIQNRNLIFAGQQIYILTGEGLVHSLREGETLASIASLYGVAQSSIIAANRLREGRLPERGERLIIPGLAAPSARQAAASFDWPLSGRISSPFGWRTGGFHYGIDIAAPLGSTFFAAAAGEVIFTGFRGSYGLLVEIEHGGGWSSRYAHTGEILVSDGRRVEQGEAIGHVGLTGNTTGPHLHFEILHFGRPLDPFPILP